MIVQARYSCSDNKTLTRGCGRVKSLSDQRSSARCRTSDDRPSGPPISRLILSPDICQSRRRFASCGVDSALPSTSRAMTRSPRGIDLMSCSPSRAQSCSALLSLPRRASGISRHSSCSSRGNLFWYSATPWLTQAGILPPTASTVKRISRRFRGCRGEPRVARGRKSLGLPAA